MKSTPATATWLAQLAIAATVYQRAVATPLAAAAAPPAQYTPNPRVGPGGGRFKDSAHFRVYDATNDAMATNTLNTLESAYECFVQGLGWRSVGLSIKSDNDNGPWYKMNVYHVASIPGAAANTGSDMTLGFPYLNVATPSMNEPAVTVHEFGHALTYAARYWIDQTRTGAWWETVANFVADTYLTHNVCTAAREKYRQAERDTIMDLRKVIGDSHQVIVDGSRDTGNYYQAWPLLTYLTNNPDNITGMGWAIFPGVWDRYARNSNETPLHVLARLAPSTRIQAIIGRYWARMAFVDIGHPKAQVLFQRERGRINYANLDALAGGRYRPKSARQPRYMGANIIPLKTGGGTVSVAISGASGPYTATLVVKGAGGGNAQVRYVDIVNGAAQASVAAGGEAALVVANTPGSLLLYDGFNLSNEARRGLDYQVQITGATV